MFFRMVYKAGQKFGLEKLETSLCRTMQKCKMRPISWNPEILSCGSKNRSQ